MNKGYSWKNNDGKIFLQRCHECGRENYAHCVAKGVCAWCEYDANEDKNIDDKLSV